MEKESDDGLTLSTEELAAELAMHRQLIGIALAHNPLAMAEARTISLQFSRDALEASDNSYSDAYVSHAIAVVGDVIRHAEASAKRPKG